MCFYMVRVGGFEPTTNRLKVYCSTNWAILALCCRRNALLDLRWTPALRKSAKRTKQLRSRTIFFRFINYFLLKMNGRGYWDRTSDNRVKVWCVTATLTPNKNGLGRKNRTSVSWSQTTNSTIKLHREKTDNLSYCTPSVKEILVEMTGIEPVVT